MPDYISCKRTGGKQWHSRFANQISGLLVDFHQRIGNVLGKKEDDKEE